MKTWGECCEEVGYVRNELCPIQPEKVAFAYKNGEVKKFDSLLEAQKFSKNTEVSVTNQKDIDAWWDDRRKLEIAAYDVWNTSLKEEYDHLSEEVFSICYGRAWDESHSYGPDEVANTMIGMDEFARRIIEASK